MSRDPRAELATMAEHAGVELDELVEWWTERAAVREFDGGQPRPEAEQGALDDVRQMLEVGAWVFAARKGPRSAAPSAPVDASRKRVPDR